MKTHLTISMAATALSILTSLPTAANDNYEEVVVTANKNKQPLSHTLPTTNVITALDIQKMQAPDLPSLLGRVSGISFRDSGGRGSNSGIFIRGTTSAQVVILIDGIRSASATVGATALENIPIETIERVEIVKGPLSSLYGADALGGVIQVFTKTGKSAADSDDYLLESTARMSVGSHHLQDYNVSLNGGNDKHQFFASFSQEDTRGIDRTDLKINGNQDKDSFEQKSASLSALFTVNEQLKTQVKYMKSEGRTEFDNVFGLDENRYSESELENIGAKLLYNPMDTIQLTLDLGYFSDHSTTPKFESDFFGRSDIQTRRHSLALQGNFSIGENHLLTLGSDYYNDDVSTLADFSETQRDNQGYFAQWQASFGDINLTSSLRYDDNQAYGGNTNGSAAASYRFNDDLELVLSYGTAFRAPTFNELYYPFFGNPEVKPEESKTYELSLRGSLPGFNWRASTYRANVDNLIGFDLATFTAGNTARATLEGVELEVKHQVGHWDLSANVDYLEARNEDTHEYLDGRAAVSANLQLGRSFLQSLYLGVDIKAEHGRHDLEGVSLPGFAIWGVSAVYDATDKLKVSGRVDNVFDKDYTLNLATSSVAYKTDGLAAKLSVQYSFR